MMEAGSQFIEMVVGDLEGHFVGDSNQIISMDNSDGDSDGHHLGNSGIVGHQNGTEVVYTEGPNGVIMEGDEIVQEVGQDDGSGNEEYVDGHDEQIVVGNQSRLIISQERGMFVPSSESLSSVDQPGYIAMKPGIPGQNMELGDIVYGQNTMGHIILQEGVDNEMIVEGNVEVGDDVQGGSDTPHGEIILVPNTVLKQDIIESGEVIVGSNMHAQHVGNEIIIEEHTAGHGGRHHTGINLTDLDDDGAFGDSNLIIDTSAIKEESVGPSVGYDCGECGAVMKSRGALKKHIGRFHASQEPEPLEMPNKIYSCPSCPYQTPRRDKLDKHVAKHVAEGYSPSGKKRSKTTPPQRMRHAAEEYKCPLCPYKCTVEKAFKKHMKLHQSGTKHFVVKVSCKICGKDRSSETDLRKHMKKHKEGRDFICDICGFASIQLKKIIQHRRMHTGEKPHLCPHCSYRSARRDNLRSHVRRMHKKENMYIDTFNPSPKERSPQNSF